MNRRSIRNPKYPENMLMMVEFINSVGLSKIRKYFTENTRMKDFDRNLEIVRYSAKFGYTPCSIEFDISRQRAEQIMKRFYEAAIEIERGDTLP